MDDKTYFPWRDPDGVGLPDASEQVIIFDSTVAYGTDAAPHYRCFWVDLSITTSVSDPTQEVHLMKLYTRPDGTSFWLTVESVTVDDGIDLISFFVSPYRNWRIMFQNGVAPQATFDVEMVIDHSSRDTPA